MHIHTATVSITLVKYIKKSDYTKIVVKIIFNL